MSMTQGMELTDAVLPTGNPFLVTLDHPQLEDGVSSINKNAGEVRSTLVVRGGEAETTQVDDVQVGIYKERKKKKREEKEERSVYMYRTYERL